MIYPSSNLSEMGGGMEGIYPLLQPVVRVTRLPLGQK